ncbi:hypothetical protein LTR86_004922 [Recurvomyces mirabilis]|nr:hypothetical protein LTR86_004922 [Recurvomyces mirabilis]
MAMEVDEPVRATSARKRRLTQPLDEDEDEGPDWSHYDATTASSKRSRAGAGHAVERRRVRVDTQALIRSFAFTSLNVTFNFNCYNPTTSPTIMFLLSGSSYTTYLSDMILRSTTYAPDLQALALARGTPADSWMFNKLLTQILPIHTIDEVQIEADEGLQDYLVAYAGSTDLVTLLDAEGNCIWDSSELNDRHKGGSAEPLLHDIERAMASNLSNLKTADEMEVAMY